MACAASEMSLSQDGCPSFAVDEGHRYPNEWSKRGDGRLMVREEVSEKGHKE